MELVEFLRARLDEDEAVAREAARAERADTWTTLPDSYGGVLDGTGRRSLAIGYGNVMAPETAAHIARHDPARVLREVEAKRELVRQYEHLKYDVVPDDLTGVWAIEKIMRAQARAHRAHPDFDPAWLED